MRVLLGIVIGGLLTIGGAYLYDNHHATKTANASVRAQQPMVNWDVVGHKWATVTSRARSEWNRLASQ
jgi:hypothetical protein